jgi:DNA-binding beta-propeller fold protein YncE
VRAAFTGLAALVAVLGCAAPASARYEVAGSWGSEGKAPGEFGSGVLGGGANRQWDDPAGIAVARNGTILVVDTSNNRVQRFTAEGRYLGKFGRRGLDKGFVKVRLTNRFFQPEGIAVDRAGNIYVADSGNDRVMKFNSRGRFRKRLGKHGSFPGEYVQPWGVAVGGRTVFVIDQGNYRIHRRSLGGAYRGAFGRFGRGAGEFVTPYGVAATPAGDRLWVTDHIRHKVMAFSSTGALLGEFGGPGVARGEFLKPAGVAVGPDGTLFVADRCNRRIQRFTADGQFLESFGRGALRTPTFLALDGAGNVYVSDHHRVVKFSPVASGSAVARPAHHDGVDIQCRHVAERNGVDA